MDSHAGALWHRMQAGQVRLEHTGAGPPDMQGANVDHRAPQATPGGDDSMREARAMMGIVEFGAVRVYVADGQEALSVLQALVRHITNKETATLLGISERTVRRWKREGRLPSRHGEQVMLVELLEYLAPVANATGTTDDLPQGGSRTDDPP